MSCIKTAWGLLKLFLDDKDQHFLLFGQVIVIPRFVRLYKEIIHERSNRGMTILYNPH